MKNRLVAAFGVALVVVGCRTIVGIDDLTYSAPPPDGGNTQQNQGSNACAAGPTCRQCCKQRFTSLVETYEHVDAAVACLCQSGCGSSCATGDGGCDTAVPATDAAPGECVACVDNLLSEGRSNPCASACTDPECQAGLDCLARCQ